MNKYRAQTLLPKVGDQRWEIPTVVLPGEGKEPKPERCIVVHVHPAHLWYTVQFENGFRESYKVPKVKPLYGGGPAR